METVLTIVLIALIGLVIGVLSGMLGIGGGMMMVPVLRLGMGLSAIMATATSLFAIIPISISGAITRIRGKTCIPKLGIIMGLGGAVSSSLGVRLASISPSWLIMLAAAVIIVYTAANMIIKGIKMGNASKKQVQSQAVGQAQEQLVQIAEAPYKLTAKKVTLALLIGFFAGLASGYVGVGGGFIMVPLMTAWLGVSMKMASGTSLIGIVVLAVPGVVQQAFMGNVDFIAGIMLCCGAIPGAVLGAKLAPRVPERTLRFIFAGVLILAGILLVLNEFGIMS